MEKVYFDIRSCLRLRFPFVRWREKYPAYSTGRHFNYDPIALNYCAHQLLYEKGDDEPK